MALERRCSGGFAEKFVKSS
jgi:hypothetical protein